MRIFRVEHHKSRKGAFCSGAAKAYDNVRVDGYSCYDLPGPHTDTLEIQELFFKDGIFKYPRGFRFGLIDVDQMKLWFPCAAGRAAMEDKGMVFSEYEIDPHYVIVGNYQIVFKSRYANLISKYNITTLEELEM